MGSEGGSVVPLFLLVGLFAMMYFLVIRPNQQRRRQMQQMQETLQPGAEVITIGGLYGTVVDLDAESVTLEVAPGVTNRYARAAIGRTTERATAAGVVPDEPGTAAGDPLDDPAREPRRPEDPAGR